MEGGIVHISQVTCYAEWQEFVRNCYIAYPDIFIICVIASAVFGFLCYNNREEILFRINAYSIFVISVITFPLLRLLCYDTGKEIVFRIKGYWNLIKVLIKRR